MCEEIQTRGCLRIPHWGLPNHADKRPQCGAGSQQSRTRKKPSQKKTSKWVKLQQIKPKKVCKIRKGATSKWQFTTHEGNPAFFDTWTWHGPKNLRFLPFIGVGTRKGLRSNILVSTSFRLGITSCSSLANWAVAATWQSKWMAIGEIKHEKRHKTFDSFYRQFIRTSENLVVKDTEIIIKKILIASSGTNISLTLW